MHFRCVVGLFFALVFLVNFCSVLLMFVFCFSIFGVFVFETSCILGFFLVGFWLLHLSCVVGSVLHMFLFCFSLFGIFVFETSCILGLFLVGFWLLDLFGLFL